MEHIVSSCSTNYFYKHLYPSNFQGAARIIWFTGKKTILRSSGSKLKIVNTVCETN